MFGKRKQTETGADAAATAPRRSRLVTWIRRLAIAGLVVVALVSGFLFWLMESAGRGDLSDRLLRLSNRILTGSSNLRVYAEAIRVRGGTVDLQTLQVDVKEGGLWYRVLDAKRAHFSADVQALLWRRPQVFDLRLSSPVIHIVTAADGKIVLPQFQSRGKGGGGGLEDGLVVTLDDAYVRAHARGDSVQWWEDGALVARLRPEGRGYVIGLDHLKGRCPPLGLVLRSASGSATAAADTVRLATLVAETDAGRVHLAGTLAGHAIAGDFQADDWAWGVFGGLLEQPALDVPGGVSVRGQVAGTVEHPEFRTLLDGHWRSEPFRGAIDGRIQGGGLAVSRAELNWRSARFAGTADFKPAGRWQI